MEKDDWITSSKEERSRVMAADKAKGHQARNEGAFFLAQTWAAISASRQQAARKTKPCFPRGFGRFYYPWLLLARHPDEQCKLARIPKSNVKFWKNKIRANRQRDV
jgi:DNA mismatch endonuclease (patch repair protein)